MSGRSKLSKGIVALASIALVPFASCSHHRVPVEVGIVYRGGPAPGISNTLRPGSIRILSADGSVMASGRTADGALFRTSLPTGTYRIEARSGDAQCVVRSLTIHGGSDTNILVPCSVK